MLQEQYEKLMQAAAEGAYMSIAVNSDGTPVRGSFVPWERTVSAFNMKKPEITIAVSDLQDAEVIDALKRCVLTGCYIAGGSLPVNCFEFCKCKVDDTSSLSEINSGLSTVMSVSVGTQLKKPACLGSTN